MPGAAPSREERITSLLVGAIDLHCHSGPSIMPRSLDHIEALHEAAAAGFRAMLIKDHYYSATPITELLNKQFGHLGVTLLSGVPLNNALGGFNVYAVDHGIKLGARLVWMPTFTAKNHIEANARSKGFPHTSKPLLEPDPLTVLDADGRLIDAVKPILDMIAEHDVVLSAGHLHISEIYPLFDEAKRRGVKRLLVNHPTFLIGCSLDDIRALVAHGRVHRAFVLHVHRDAPRQGADVLAARARCVDQGGHGRAHDPRFRPRSGRQRPARRGLPQHRRHVHRSRFLRRRDPTDDRAERGGADRARRSRASRGRLAERRGVAAGAERNR